MFSVETNIFVIAIMAAFIASVTGNKEISGVLMLVLFLMAGFR